jgi:hypothetical protein
MQTSREIDGLKKAEGRAIDCKNAVDKLLQPVLVL